jgi:hypothetical protein
MVKIFSKVPDSLNGRYSPAACIGARKVSVQGHLDPKHISTSYAERNNPHGG